MNLYIQVDNGQPINHPALEENLVQSFGQVPANWEPFVRVEKPIPPVYKKVSEEPVYEKVNDVWTDVWNFFDMTAEEKIVRQQQSRDIFFARGYIENWSAWVFDEATCRMQPPIPRLDLNQDKLNAGIFTWWCGADNNWKDTPAHPVDNNQYTFDFYAWQWVQIAL